MIYFFPVQFLEEPFLMDCVASPALVRPRYDPKTYLYYDENDAEDMRQKIRTILYACSKNGNDTVVLSALGCGAFKNPPFQVAKVRRIKKS